MGTDTTTRRQGQSATSWRGDSDDTASVQRGTTLGRYTVLEQHSVAAVWAMCTLLGVQSCGVGLPSRFCTAVCYSQPGSIGRANDYGGRRNTRTSHRSRFSRPGALGTGVLPKNWPSPREINGYLIRFPSRRRPPLFLGFLAPCVAADSLDGAAAAAPTHCS